ncbi:MAG: 2-oxo acid dehydrogenase subunit E2 [Clostridia bacterium]|nr:2-oxo acid dehydrogenase subunit E2 [Clostridia bacterium]
MIKRTDAVRIKELDGFHSIVPYVMPKRTEAEVSSFEKFDVTDLVAYMKKHNEEDGTNLKLFHAICTAAARTIYLRPKMNIFIAGRRFWQRKDITLSFVVKRTFNDVAEESLMTLKVDPDMTFSSISKKILGDVDEVRRESGNELGKTMDFVGKLPRCILVVLFGFLRLLEYFGVMPKSLMKGDPNYSTVLLSNLGSIGAGAPYHHLSNYGTCSIMVTIGTMHPETCRMPDGTEQERSIVDLTLTLDERIADGFYFAKSLRITKYLLEHPESLEETISTPVPVAL